MDKTISLIKIGFEISSETTREFVAFSKIFKQELKKDLKGIAKLTAFTRGHFYISGFVRDIKDNCYYFSIPDVRFFPDYGIMFRTAKGEKDFTGGKNCYLKMENLREDFLHFKDN